MRVWDRDVDDAVLQRCAVHGRHGRQWAVAIQNVGQHARSSRRHVQYDKDRIRQVRRQTGGELAECFDPTGRRANRYDVDRTVFFCHFAPHCPSITHRSTQVTCRQNVNPA